MSVARADLDPLWPMSFGSEDDPVAGAMRDWSVESQLGPLCTNMSGSATCVLSAGHEGGCFMRSR